VISPVWSPKIKMRGQLILLPKVSIESMELATPWNEPSPIRWPPSQLSSIKRKIEVWSVME